MFGSTCPIVLVGQTRSEFTYEFASMIKVKCLSSMPTLVALSLSLSHVDIIVKLDTMGLAICSRPRVKIPQALSSILSEFGPCT